MAWIEPLRADVLDQGGGRFLVRVRDRTGILCASVQTVRATVGTSGWLGEMQTSAGGSPQQTRRALVLLVRTALAHARGAGLTEAHTLIPPNASPALVAFARLMSGRSEGAGEQLGGDLDEMYQHNQAHTDADGGEQ